jgi:hypothetical protein
MDRMQAAPRGAFFGLLSDLASGTVGYMQDPRRTQQLQGLGAMLESTRIPSLLEGLSYGDSMTTGSGMTMRPNEDVRGLIELATAFAPAGKPAAAATKAGAMALGRAGERVGMAAEKALEAPLQRVYDKGGLPREMLLAMGQNTVSPATVFHGSPHLFPRFDSSKIGTGEGAQAYGHGLYLAEAKDVAESYKDVIQGLPLSPKAKQAYTVITSDVHPYVKQKALANLPKEAIEEAKSFGGGNLYQVDLPDEQIAKMLDYDKPLSKQPPAVQAWLRSPYNAYRNQLTAKDIGGNEPTGAMILGKLQELMSEGKKNDVFTNAANFGAANASRELAEAGIPGIRYLDQNSRATPNITNKRLADLYEKYQGNAEAAVDEMMRSVYNTPKKKAEMREQFMKQLQLQTPKTSNFVVFPGMEDMLRIEQINEQPIDQLIKQGLIGQF